MLIQRQGGIPVERGTLCVSHPMSTFGTDICATHVDHPVKDKQGCHPSVSFVSLFISPCETLQWACLFLYLSPFPWDKTCLSEYLQWPTASVNRAMYVDCIKNRCLMFIQGNKMQLLFTAQNTYPALWYILKIINFCQSTLCFCVTVANNWFWQFEWMIKFATNALNSNLIHRQILV